MRKSQGFIYFENILLEKRLAEKNVMERDLEKKDQALQVAVLRIRDLEYAKENYLEFQDQAKVVDQIYRCLKIREFRIQSVVGDHFSSPKMEKKNRDFPQKIHLISKK
jgi:hypothetical protein